MLAKTVVDKGVVLLACRARFLSYVHFVWDIPDILSSITSFDFGHDDDPVRQV